MAPTQLDLSLGAIEVGILIGTFLFGVTTVQVYVYFSGTAQVPKTLRWLVSILWIVESLSTFFLWHYLYRVTVTYYGDSNMVATSHWTLETSAFFNGLAGALVQGYFAHRIQVLSRSWIVTIISWIGSLVAFMATTAIMITSIFNTLPLVEYSKKFNWLLTGALVLLLFVDIVNTLALCAHLRVERTGSLKIDSIFNKMFLWTLETGIITSIAALLMVVFSQALPGTALWECISYFYAKLYSNSLMASLNGREHLRVSRLGVTSVEDNAEEFTYPTFTSTMQTQDNSLQLSSPRKSHTFGFLPGA